MSARRPYPEDGRVFRRSLTARSTRLENGRTRLQAPAVGLWRGAPAPGTLVMPRGHLGELEVLGVLHQLVADEHSHGLVVGEVPGARTARVAVDYATVLLELDPSAGAVLAVEAEAEAGPAGGLAFRSPSSGRFYLRPAPDKAAFIEPGAILQEGQTVCLLEVMKTFHRISYGGAGLPKRAKVIAVVPGDGADVEAGDVLLSLEEVG